MHFTSQVPKQELIPLSSPERWNEALSGVPHSFAHTWESCFAMSRTTHYPTYLYCLEFNGTKIICPIAERMFQGHTDIVTPYGFSGFTGNGALENFPEIWKAFARANGYLCGYIGLNPFLRGSLFVDPKDLYSNNQLYAIDLTLSTEQLFSKLSTNRKRQLKHFSTNMGIYSTDKSQLKTFFLESYHAFFAKRHASSVYNFSQETLQCLVDLDNVFMVGVMRNEKVEAVSLFAYTEFVAEYLFNVSAPEGQEHTASLIWYAVQFLKEKQIPLLNLGGGVKDGDSIAQFKLRFGPDVVPLEAARQIYDAALYEKICSGLNIDPKGNNGYFPAYRQVRQMDQQG